MTTAEQPEPNPESIHRHDPEVNRRFTEIFAHEDNVGLARFIVVGLATNDPAPDVDAPVNPNARRPAPGSLSDAPTPSATETYHRETSDPTGFSVEGILAVDSDGDRLNIAHMIANDDDTSRDRFVFAVNGPSFPRVALTRDAAEEICDWLCDALDDEEE